MTQENLDELIAFVEGEKERLKDIAEEAGRLVAYTEALSVLKATSAVRERSAKHLLSRLYLDRNIYFGDLATSKKAGDKIGGSVADGKLSAINILMKLVDNLAKKEEEQNEV